MSLLPLKESIVFNWVPKGQGPSRPLKYISSLTGQIVNHGDCNNHIHCCADSKYCKYQPFPLNLVYFDVEGDNGLNSQIYTCNTANNRQHDAKSANIMIRIWKYHMEAQCKESLNKIIFLGISGWTEVRTWVQNVMHAPTIVATPIPPSRVSRWGSPYSLIVMS